MPGEGNTPKCDVCGQNPTSRTVLVWVAKLGPLPVNVCDTCSRKLTHPHELLPDVMPV